MPATIRLRRVGRKKQPSFRIVVMDSRKSNDSDYIDLVGFYNPRRQPAELRLDLDKADHWIGNGAQTSDTVASLIRKARKGGDDTVELLTMEEPAEEESPEQAEEGEESEEQPEEEAEAAEGAEAPEAQAETAEEAREDEVEAQAAEAEAADLEEEDAEAEEAEAETPRTE